jgi:hypothetical protein
MSQRSIWTFQVPIERLLQSVERKIDHHTEREAYYEQRVRAIQEDIRQTGIDWNSTLNPQLQGYSQGYSPEPTLDPQKKKDLSDHRSSWPMA